MAKQSIHKGTTSKSISLMIRDVTKNDGSGLTALTNASSGLSAYYWRQGAATPVAITLVSGTVGSWTSGGFKEVDATNTPGLYQLDLPDAVLASGAAWAIVMLKGATNMVIDPLEIQLTDVDVNDGAYFGLSSLPDIQTDVDDLQTTLADVQTDVDELQVTAATLATSAALATAQTAITDIQTDVDELQVTAATLATATALGAVQTDVTDVQTDVDDIQTRLPLALVSGKMDSTVSSLPAGTLSDIAQSVWSYVSRTLTQLITAVVPPPVVTGTTLTFLRGETISVGFTGLGDLTGYTQIWFTVKHGSNKPDSKATIQVTATGGLVRLNGQGTTASWGSLTIDDLVNGNVTIVIKPDASQFLEPAQNYTYDIQTLIGGKVTTKTQGLVIINADVTEAIA